MCLLFANEKERGRVRNEQILNFANLGVRALSHLYHYAEHIHVHSLKCLNKTCTVEAVCHK